MIFETERPEGDMDVPLGNPPKKRKRRPKRGKKPRRRKKHASDQEPKDTLWNLFNADAGRWHDHRGDG